MTVIIAGITPYSVTTLEEYSVAGLAQLVEQAHIYGGVCLAAEGPGFESDQWRFPACLPPLSLPFHI